jgi:anthranilate synthase component 2
LIITAETKDKIIMAIMNNKYKIHGVQFHPESIKTSMGLKILKNLINYKYR